MHRMKNIFFALLLISLLGLASSVVMTRQHYKIQGIGFEEKSFCNVSEFIDCDTAIASRYARIGRIPNAEIGILYYLLVSLGILYAWFSEKRKATFAFLFISSLFAVAYSILMAYLSLFKLHVLCLLCTTNYVSSLLLMLLFPRVLRIRYRDIPKFVFQYIQGIFGLGGIQPRLVFHLGATAFLFVGGILFFFGLNPQVHRAYARIPKAEYLKAYYGLPQKTIHLPDRPFWGNKQGRVTIVEFSDFQCPFCRLAAFSLKPYLKEFQKDVSLVYLNYPLDTSCNPSVPQTMHPVACLSAKGALCAFQSGKFWEYHDQLFENQRRLSHTVLVNAAQNIGLNKVAFEQCLASEETTNLLKEDIESGLAIELRGTPAVFINGRFFSDWGNPELLRMVIESEIKGSKSD